MYSQKEEIEAELAASERDEKKLHAKDMSIFVVFVLVEFNIHVC